MDYFRAITEQLEQLAVRIQGYLSTTSGQFKVAFELVIIWIAVYLILRALRGTRGLRVLKGMAVVLIAATILVKLLISDPAFERLTFLYGSFLKVAALVLVIVFAPELRRALVRLGEGGWFRSSTLRKSEIIEALVSSIEYLSENKIGALIAIERRVSLEGIVESGTRLDAQVSRELLNTIFWPGSSLHDMGVVIRGDRLVLAAAQFPLAEGENFVTELGSRHRAAVGLSQEADALVIVVSEETGTVSVAERGRLERPLSPAQLRTHLARSLGLRGVVLAAADGKTARAEKKTAKAAAA